MKSWAVTILAVIGGYIVLKFVAGQRAHYTGASGELGGTQTTVGNIASQASGVVGFVAPIPSGVPTFNNAQIANGHGDQVAAAYHTNTFATIPGGPTYEPAFGPNTNQDPTNPVYFI